MSFVLPAAENVFSVSPYVQHPTADGMTVLFFTTKPCEATVKCWPAEGADATPSRVITESATCEEATDVNATWATDDKLVWGTQYRHRARFEKKLSGGTRYCYAVEPVGYSAYTNFFSTVPDRNTPVRFVAYSDSECIPPTYRDTAGADENGCTKEWDVLVNGANQTKTYYVSRSVGFASNLWHMAAWKPDLFVIAGDLVARGGVQMFWDEFWKENAGANAKGYADWAGSIPILAVMGNHDNYDNNGQTALSYGTGKQGECGITKYLSYFEFNPNGVDYANASGAHSDERYSKDRSQMFHREDYGPVTLIFVDTNNETDSAGNDTNTGLSSGSSGARAPGFKPGTLQYEWLTNNLADAQMKSRFTFVINHHCPYSRGKHNRPRKNTNEAQSALPVREHLTDAMVRYGVTGWLCGHEETVEHATVTGTETLPDGTTRPHTVHVFDLGSGGDGLKGKPTVTCDNVDFRAYDTADGTHYGHLRVEVRRNAAQKWECVMSQVYDYLSSAKGPFELRKYNEYVVESAADPDEPPAPSGGELTDLSPSATAANPVALLSDTQRDYLYVKTVDERCTAAAAAQEEGRESAGAKLFCFGSPVTLTWKGGKGECTVSVKRLSDGKVVVTETTDGTSLVVCNLELGEQYEWTVACGEESASATFCTDDTPPRLIRSGRMRMMRDLGGWTGTLGGKQYRIRQNLIFRGAAADCPDPDEYLADDTARAFFRDVVGLRNEVDFRNLNDIGGDVSSGAKSTGKYMLDPTGEYGIAYNNFSFTAGSTLPTSGKFPEAMKFLADPANLPAYFHCKSGRDRTGMAAGFLLALLGVSRDDIIRDYQTTSDKNYYAKYGFKDFLDSTLPNYKSSQLSLAENAKAYLIDRGMTDGQVEDFRKKMLFGYDESPTPPAPTYWVEEPVYVKATRTQVSGGTATETQYTGFLTKKGREYAWGKDGEAKTDWKLSDGTPMELPKPEGDGWELLVR